MAVDLERFNRIIDISFESNNNGAMAPGEFVRPTSIICPRRGRKPTIEINGTFTTKNYMPTFNLTIKNLYLDLQGKQYSKIKIKAGYENQLTTIEGTILTMYQEQPGPEGRTVIQCMYGNVQEWLDAMVELQFDKGAMLSDVLYALKSKLKAKDVKVGKKAGGLTLKEPLQFTGTARQALDELKKRFEEERLLLFIRGTIICAICLVKEDDKENPEPDKIETAKLQYMSAPPQENTGDEAGAYYTTITAPWMPELSIGDILEIPARVYIRNFGTVGGAAKTQKIQVTALSFHFGTTGTTNSMTVQGFMVR